MPPSLKWIAVLEPADDRRGVAFAHSNRLTMNWYFSMYQRFSLLYLGIDTGRTFSPSAFHTQGQRTGSSSACSPMRLNSFNPTFMRPSTRYSLATLRGPPL